LVTVINLSVDYLSSMQIFIEFASFIYYISIDETITTAQTLITATH